MPHSGRQSPNTKQASAFRVANLLAWIHFPEKMLDSPPFYHLYPLPAKRPMTQACPIANQTRQLLGEKASGNWLIL